MYKHDDEFQLETGRTLQILLQAKHLFIPVLKTLPLKMILRALIIYRFLILIAFFNIILRTQYCKTKKKKILF
jgi:hypothetical protein